jgi:hypothetical protein
LRQTIQAVSARVYNPHYNNVKLIAKSGAKLMAPELQWKQESSSHTGRNIIIGVVIVIVLGLAILYFVGGFGNGSTPGVIGGGPSPLAPSQATVSGSASTSGSGTSATEVLFTSGAGTTYSAPVSGGQFSIQLPNPGAYSIQVKWVGSYSWQGGTVSVSNPLDLNIGPGGSSSVSDSVSVSTPDSTESFSGGASTTTYGTSAESISFTGTSGGPITATISGGSYSITLPNEMSYTVQIQYSDAFGGGTCTASSSFNVNVPAGQLISSVPNFSC